VGTRETTVRSQGWFVIPVVPSTVNSTFLLSQAYLTVCENALATTVGGIPAVTYVYPSRPPVDCCPALVVWMGSLSEETTSPISPPASTGHRASYGRLNLVTLTAWALRCSPPANDDGSVSLVEIDRVAQETQQDGWALWNHIYAAINDGTFLDICTAVHFDRAAALEERGNCLGWSMTIRAELGGIPH
jgi:hypothetical protein